MAEKDVTQLPFFAQFLESQDDLVPVINRTLKYPSDSDEW